eukprot:800344-Amphidinium_carterae.1
MAAWMRCSTGMSSPWLAEPKFQLVQSLVGHNCGSFAICYNDSLSLQSLTRNHDSVELGFINRLPAPW